MNDQPFLKRPSTWIVVFLIISLYFVIRNSQPQQRTLTQQERSENAVICTRWGGHIDPSGNCVNAAGRDISGE